MTRSSSVWPHRADAGADGVHPVDPDGAMVTEALAGADRRAVWYEEPLPPGRGHPDAGRTDADLVVIGAGFTGLWAAHAALDRSRRVVVLEAEEVAFGASGRNGGFVDPSLTHGLENGLAHWGDEIEVLERLAREGWDELVADLGRFGLPDVVEEVGEMAVAIAPHEVADLAESAALHRHHGHEVRWLEGDDLRAEVRSPLYEAAMWRTRRCGLTHPVRLARGLAAAAERRGATIHERSRVADISPSGRGVSVELHSGAVVGARRVLVATNAYPPLLRRLRRRIIPVYDHVIATEPLTADQWDAIGWASGQGIGDTANQFHYYRPTADGRIVFGGYDAIYHFASRVDPSLDQRDSTHRLLTAHLLATFPQLEGIGITHRWGGPIATTADFAATIGADGPVGWAAGYTGLGVAASRWAARTALDLLERRDTVSTRTSFVGRKPFPFPPEPFRWAVVEATTRALKTADRSGARRGAWLRLLDRLGVGFDS